VTTDNTTRQNLNRCGHFTRVIPARNHAGSYRHMRILVTRATLLRGGQTGRMSSIPARPSIFEFRSSRYCDWVALVRLTHKLANGRHPCPSPRCGLPSGGSGVITPTLYNPLLVPGRDSRQYLRAITSCSGTHTGGAHGVPRGGELLSAGSWLVLDGARQWPLSARRKRDPGRSQLRDYRTITGYGSKSRSNPFRKTRYPPIDLPKKFQKNAFNSEVVSRKGG